MMYYALIESKNGEGYFMRSLSWGELDQIARAVLDECGLIFDSMPNMSLEELDNEYYCSFSDYNELQEAETPTLSMIRGFYFCISDMEVSVEITAESYAEFREKFQNHMEDDWSFEGRYLVEEFEETPENLEQLADEIRSVGSDYCYADSFEFLCYTDEDEEEDEEDEDEDEE